MKKIGTSTLTFILGIVVSFVMNIAATNSSDGLFYNALNNYRSISGITYIPISLINRLTGEIYGAYMRASSPTSMITISTLPAGTYLVFFTLFFSKNLI